MIEVKSTPLSIPVNLCAGGCSTGAESAELSPSAY